MTITSRFINDYVLQQLIVVFLTRSDWKTWTNLEVEGDAEMEGEGGRWREREGDGGGGRWREMKRGNEGIKGGRDMSF